MQNKFSNFLANECSQPSGQFFCVMFLCVFLLWYFGTNVAAKYIHFVHLQKTHLPIHTERILHIIILQQDKNCNYIILYFKV